MLEKLGDASLFALAILYWLALSVVLKLWPGLGAQRAEADSE